MLLLALMAVLSQAEPKCVTTNGTRVCGYGCIDNGSSARCAQTPDGVCGKSGSVVTCFDPPLWLAALHLSVVPKPTCVYDGGNLACGYDCKREGGRVACAQTPKGMCQAQYGALVCADPPPEVYAVLGDDTPSPTCKAQDGTVTCGYQCLAAGGRIACAKTPFGVCAENGGTPLCLDPGKAVICAKGKSVERPACVKQSGTLVCGYHCAVGGAQASCAATPDGSCDTAGPGKPVCFDPPVRGGSAACLEAAAASTR